MTEMTRTFGLELMESVLTDFPHLFIKVGASLQVMKVNCSRHKYERLPWLRSSRVFIGVSTFICFHDKGLMHDCGNETDNETGY